MLGMTFFHRVTILFFARWRWMLLSAFLVRNIPSVDDHGEIGGRITLFKQALNVLRCSLIFLTLLLVLMPQAGAATYYVDTSVGSDCTDYNPTLRACGIGTEKAFNAINDVFLSGNTREGDTVYLMDDNYTIDNTMDQLNVNIAEGDGYLVILPYETTTGITTITATHTSASQWLFFGQNRDVSWESNGERILRFYNNGATGAFFSGHTGATGQAMRFIGVEIDISGNNQSFIYDYGTFIGTRTFVKSYGVSSLLIGASTTGGVTIIMDTCSFDNTRIFSSTGVGASNTVDIRNCTLVDSGVYWGGGGMASGSVVNTILVMDPAGRNLPFFAGPNSIDFLHSAYFIRNRTTMADPCHYSIASTYYNNAFTAGTELFVLDKSAIGADPYFDFATLQYELGADGNDSYIAGRGSGAYILQATDLAGNAWTGNDIGALANPPQIPFEPIDNKVVFVGDSITTNAGFIQILASDSDLSSYTFLEADGATCTAVSGMRIQGIHTLAGLLLWELAPEFLVIHGGINNTASDSIIPSGMSSSELADKIVSIAEMADNWNIKPISVLMGSDNLDAGTNTFEEAVNASAVVSLSALGTKFSDILSLMQSYGDGWKLHYYANNSQVHPNSNGYALYASEIKDMILSAGADTTFPILVEVTPISTPTNDPTPLYTFSTTEAGTITMGGSCDSATTSAISGNNTITFNALADGTYSDCLLRVTDSAGNISSWLSISAFTVDTQAPAVSITAPAASSTATGGTTIVFTNDEETSPECSVDGSTWTACVSGITTLVDLAGWPSVSTGSTFTLSLRDTDLAGNTGTDTNTDITKGAGAGVDTTPPVRSGGSPSGTLAAGTTTATLSVTTDEAATCKAGTTANTAYADLPTTLSGAVLTHTGTLAGLTNGTSYTYYVRCRDNEENTNDDDYSISFSLAAASSSSSSSFAVANTTRGGGRGGTRLMQSPSSPSVAPEPKRSPALLLLLKMRERLMQRIEQRLATVQSAPALRMLEGIRERLVQRINARINKIQGW